MSKEIWKPGNMIFPLPAVLVTVSDNEGNDNVLTVAWTGTISTFDKRKGTVCKGSINKRKSGEH